MVGTSQGQQAKAKPTNTAHRTALRCFAKSRSINSSRSNAEEFDLRYKLLNKQQQLIAKSANENEKQSQNLLENGQVGAELFGFFLWRELYKGVVHVDQYARGNSRMSMGVGQFVRT